MATGETFEQVLARMSPRERRQFEALERDIQNQRATGSSGGNVPYVDPETGRTLPVARNPNAPLTPSELAQQQIDALDPYTQDILVANTETSTDHDWQRADNALKKIGQIAQDQYADLPGQDAYTINPTMLGKMSWSPNQRYQYESQFDQTRGDETGLDAQRAALAGYSEVLDEGGLTAIDRARIAQSRAMRGQEVGAQRAAIMQGAEEQGRAGGNAQMLAQMQAAQGGANARAMDDLTTQALALNRRDSAMAGLGVVGNQVQANQDAIDKFNTMGQREREMRNKAAQQRGIDTRYTDERNTSIANVNSRNQAEVLNKSAGYGQRGQYADKGAARAGIQNALQGRASWYSGNWKDDRAIAQQDKANAIGGVGAVAQGAWQVVNPWLTPSKGGA